MTVSLAATMLGIGAVQAAYPDRPITIIVPYAAAGITDALARTVGEKLGVELGKPVVVDYKPGANGNIGSELVAKATPDGYTLLLGSTTTHTVNPSLYKQLPFNVFKDFRPITQLAVVQNVIVVSPSLPIHNLQELIQYAKANPDKLSYGSAGNGSSLHLYAELFKKMTHTEMVHIPYKGGAPARNDLLAGHISMMFSDIGAVPFIQAGRLRALAVTGEKREPTAPNVPTAIEAGLPGYSAEAWFALFAPANTPDEIIKTLQSSLALVMQKPDVRKKLSDLGLHPVKEVSGVKLEAAMKSDYQKWAAVISSSGIKAD